MTYDECVVNQLTLIVRNSYHLFCLVYLFSVRVAAMWFGEIKSLVLNNSDSFRVIIIDYAKAFDHVDQRVGSAIPKVCYSDIGYSYTRIP